MEQIFDQIWVAVPDILLPNNTVNLSTWAVVACDQYTSEPEYWKQVEDIVGDTPSMLHLIYPEVYLQEADNTKRIDAIQNAMQTYLSQGVLEHKGAWFILIDRKTSHVASRKWLIVALDLDRYDYRPWSQSLIRATEGTVLDRLPPRIAIRSWASLESPHIMVLIDDEQKTVIEPLFEHIADYQKLYDTELMMNGGHITWYKIDQGPLISQVVESLSRLMDLSSYQAKYGLSADAQVMLFAMGDGNHSFATAKAIWEEKKKTLSPQEQLHHPARFALVELVNIHDDGLIFEPIHRVLFNVDEEHLFAAMQEYFSHRWSQITLSRFQTKEDMKAHIVTTTSHHRIGFSSLSAYGIIDISDPRSTLEVGELQSFLDEYLHQHQEIIIDYVHGRDSTISLSQKPHSLWFFLPIMDKKDFFKTVILDGALPRKTFSMGEAEEKRFYLECRSLLV